MDQQELENRVREIFEKQGFTVQQAENQFIASKDGAEKKIQVFSSQDYSADEVETEAEERFLIFVDEDLEKVKGRIENEVSVIHIEDTGERYNLPSYELIGDIAVVNELTVDEEEATEGIREHHPHVKTILVKEEPLSGEFRTGEYKKLYGDETETTHKEFGRRYRLDPTEVYFSERLGTERKRVIDQIETGERILVIGAGVGPYPILAARNAEPEKVVAVEKNPVAFDYLEQNIGLNSVGDTVEAVEGDAAEIVPELEMFDRIIIAIPEFGEKFLEPVFKHLKKGGTLHYYRFREEENWAPLLEEIDSAARKTGIEYEIKDKTVCGDRGPSVDRVCVDIERK